MMKIDYGDCEVYNCEDCGFIINSFVAPMNTEQNLYSLVAISTQF